MHSKVLKTLKDNNTADVQRFLVALSGGVDSSVLLDVLASLSKELGATVCAAHLNHMLRGADADSDEAFVKEKCASYGIELITEKIDIRALSKERKQSIELCAREERYAFLERAREKLSADVIVTAHNANDNLETVIFNLARGSGISGLCGIPYRRGNIIRPLIECTRCEIEDYAKERNISFCVDKTNDETEYTRNKIRHNVIPALLEINQSAVENTSRTSKILKTQAEYLSDEAKAFAEKIRTGKNSCDRAALLLKPALAAEVCGIYAKDAMTDENYTLSYQHIREIEGVIKSDSPSAQIALPYGLLVRREYENLVFEALGECKVDLVAILSEGENIWGNYRIYVKRADSCRKIHNLLNTFFVSCDKIEENLVVRSRKTGDEIKLHRKTKSIKKLFIDGRIPQKKRDFIPVIADSEKVFAVFGFGQNEAIESENGDGYIIEITEK